MDVFESRLGSIFVIIFALGSIVFALVSFICSSLYCKVLLIIPILPWAIFLEKWLDLSIPWATYPLFLLLNVVIIYSMGVSIEMALDRYRFQKS